MERPLLASQGWAAMASIEYTNYFFAGLALVSLVVLAVLAVTRTRTTWGIGIALLGLIVGVTSALQTDPRNMREQNQPLVMAQTDSPSVDLELIGSCLSIYRLVGPFAFNRGNDQFPGDTWAMQPPEVCNARGNMGTVNLPDSVKGDGWVLCDWDSCWPLTVQQEDS